VVFGFFFLFFFSLPPLLVVFCLAEVFSPGPPYYLYVNEFFFRSGRGIALPPALVGSPHEVYFTTLLFLSRTPTLPSMGLRDSL